MKRLARMPRVSDEVIEGNFTLRVLSVLGHRVGRLSTKELPTDSLIANENSDKPESLENDSNFTEES